MFKPILDQSLSTLHRCYAHAELPLAVDEAAYEAKTINWKLLQYGKQARRRVLCSGIFEDLLTLSVEQALNAFSEPVEVREFVWFLFGQKKWPTLFHFFVELPTPLTARLGGEVFDLLLLACFRFQPKAFCHSPECTKLLDRLETALQLLCIARPNDVERKKLFLALRAHSLGQVEEARVSLSELVTPAEFAGPFRAVDTVYRDTSEESFVHKDIAFKRIASGQRVVLVAANEKYYQAYFSEFADSLVRINKETAEPWGLHLHCVGFEPDTSRLSAGIKEFVGLSTEPGLSEHVRGNWEGAYCAASRYIHAPQLLKAYKEIFISDVDGMLNANLNTQVLREPKADVILTSINYLKEEKILNPIPWNSIAAGSTLFRDTCAAKRFSQRVSDYLVQTFYRPSFIGSAWFADQNSLFYSHLDSTKDTQFSRFEKPPFSQKNEWRQFHSK